MAEKIGSESEFRWCKSEGGAIFQGYYLREPDLLVGRRVPSNKLSLLRWRRSAPTWTIPQM